MNKPAHARGLVALVAVCTALSACAVVPARGGYYMGPAVAVAPPPPRVEYFGPPPAPGYIWIGGYWGWIGGRHVWIRGHWNAPRPGYRWVPRRWVHRRDGWHLRGGRWIRER